MISALESEAHLAVRPTPFEGEVATILRARDGDVGKAPADILGEPHQAVLVVGQERPLGANAVDLLPEQVVEARLRCRRLAELQQPKAVRGAQQQRANAQLRDGREYAFEPVISEEFFQYAVVVPVFPQPFGDEFAGAADPDSLQRDCG